MDQEQMVSLVRHDGCRASVVAVRRGQPLLGIRIGVCDLFPIRHVVDRHLEDLAIQLLSITDTTF